MATEDFTTYTEVDVPGVLTVVAIRVEFTNIRRDADAYVYKDFGAAFFGSWTADFTLPILAVEAGDADNRNSVVLMAFSSEFGTWNDMSGSADLVAINIKQNGATDDQFRFEIVENTGGVQDDSDTGAIRSFGSYYMTLRRIRGTSLVLDVYSDLARTLLIESLSITGTNNTHRYLNVVQGLEAVADPADTCSGRLESLEITSGWTGTISGVSAPAAIMGVSREDIALVKGVAG